MKLKFTPGPWNAQPGVMGGEWTLRHGPTDEVICVRANQANARLIAAAPELLAALLQAEGMLVLDGHTTRNPLVDETPVLRLVRAAIAKATGGDE